MRKLNNSFKRFGITCLVGLVGCSQVSQEERSFWMNCGGIRTIHRSKFIRYPDQETFELYESRFNNIYNGNQSLEERRKLLRKIELEIGNYLQNVVVPTPPKEKRNYSLVGA